MPTKTWAWHPIPVAEETSVRNRGRFGGDRRGVSNGSSFGAARTAPGCAPRGPTGRGSGKMGANPAESAQVRPGCAGSRFPIVFPHQSFRDSQGIVRRRRITPPGSRSQGDPRPCGDRAVSDHRAPAGGGGGTWRGSPRNGMTMCIDAAQRFGHCGAIAAWAADAEEVAHPLQYRIGVRSCSREVVVGWSPRRTVRDRCVAATHPPWESFRPSDLSAVGCVAATRHACRRRRVESRGAMVRRGDAPYEGSAAVEARSAKESGPCDVQPQSGS